MLLRSVLSFFFAITYLLALSQSETIINRVNYTIQVSLDPEAKMLLGSQEVQFINPSSDTIHTLKFHLYYNAFKHTNSTFLQGNMPLGDLVDVGSGPDCPFSYTEITAMKDDTGNDLIEYLKYTDPDSENPMDETVLTVDLLKPVLPYDTLNISLGWEAKIPKIMPRTGTNKDFYFFAQWFPKLGVYEPAGMRYRGDEGGWNCHPYYATGEYYADFGSYKVAVSVPSDYMVGASGNLMSKEQNGLYTTWKYELDKVIDFAWTCSPEFIEQSKQFGDIEMKLLSYPDHEHCAEKYFGSVGNAIEYLQEHVGSYPYSTITVIDVPIHGLFTGGMEYPTLITSMSFCFLPVGVKTTQTLTIHEFIHQYFMQMIATNETEEPWMDEGLTSYYEGRIVDHYYGNKSALIDVMGIKIGNTDYNRWEYFASSNPSIADNTFRSWEFKDGGYKIISYNKTAVWLQTLDNMVGRKVMDEIMRSYFNTWKYSHPCANDFEAIVNEVITKNYGQKFGENMDWYFDQVLRGSGVCDYRVAGIKNKKKRKAVGFIDGFENCVGYDDGDDPETLEYESTVVFERIGEISIPQEIEYTLTDGTILTENWDGRSRSFRVEYSGPEQIVQAVIDPKGKISLDRNMINNSKCVESHKMAVRYYFTRFVQWMQNSMEAVAWLS